MPKEKQTQATVWTLTRNMWRKEINSDAYLGINRKELRKEESPSLKILTQGHPRGISGKWPTRVLRQEFGLLRSTGRFPPLTSPLKCIRRLNRNNFITFSKSEVAPSLRFMNLVSRGKFRPFGPIVSTSRDTTGEMVSALRPKFQYSFRQPLLLTNSMLLLHTLSNQRPQIFYWFLSHQIRISLPINELLLNYPRLPLLSLDLIIKPLHMIVSIPHQRVLRCSRDLLPFFLVWRLFHLFLGGLFKQFRIEHLAAIIYSKRRFWKFHSKWNQIFWSRYFRCHSLIFQIGREKGFAWLFMWSHLQTLFFSFIPLLPNHLAILTVLSVYLCFFQDYTQILISITVKIWN